MNLCFEKNNTKDIALKSVFNKSKKIEKPTFEIEPETLGNITKLGNDLPIEKRIDLIVQTLKKQHPTLVFADNPKWFLTSINGQTMQYANLFASSNEFLTIVAYPYKCQCFSGRFKGMDIHSAVIKGKISAYKAGEFKPTEYTVGDVYKLDSGCVKNLEFEEGTVFLDYYRGNTLNVMSYSLILPTLFQTGDFIGVWEQIKDSFGLVFKNVTNPKND